MANFEVVEQNPLSPQAIQTRSFSRQQQVLNGLRARGVQIPEPAPHGLSSPHMNGSQTGFARGEAINEYQMPQVTVNALTFVCRGLTTEFEDRRDYNSPDIQTRMDELIGAFQADHPELPMREQEEHG